MDQPAGAVDSATQAQIFRLAQTLANSQQPQQQQSGAQSYGYGQEQQQQQQADQLGTGAASSSQGYGGHDHQQQQGSSHGSGSRSASGGGTHWRGKRAEALAFYDSTLASGVQEPTIVAAKARVEAGGRAPALADYRDGAQTGGGTAVGSDPLAAAFKAIYEADRDIVKAIADQAPREVQGDGELGVECAQRYASAEDFARDALARAIIEGA